jgi:hypothetical protein
MRGIGRTALLALALASVVSAPAAVHGGGGHTARVTGTPVELRGCFLTAAFAPRPAAPLDFGMPFYGPEPLVGVWGLACDGSRVAGRPGGALVLSLVGVPVGLTSPGAVPLANNFAHRLLRIDTSSRRLAAAARRAGLPAHATAARYRRSGLRGRMVVPGSHSMAVAASLPDPTNPHDHANLFEHRGGGRLSLSIEDAHDRFCLSPGDGCSASLDAARGSALARLLGARSAPVRAGFDHDKLARVRIGLGG